MNKIKDPPQNFARAEMPAHCKRCQVDGKTGNLGEKDTRIRIPELNLSL